MSYCVYKHTVPNGKVYIGITGREPSRRWENGNGYRHNKHFYRAIKKYGWGNIRHEILFDGLNKEDAEQKEIELIAEYHSMDKDKGYNLREGGSTSTFSEISLEKMRRSHLGKHLPDEQKIKISDSMKGRKVSDGMLGHKHRDDTKRLMRERKLGKHLSDCTKMQISENRKGICTGTNNPRAKSVKNLDTGEVFDTLRDACGKYALSHGNLSLVCSGKRKTCGGYHWSYLDASGGEYIA